MDVMGCLVVVLCDLDWGSTGQRVFAALPSRYAPISIQFQLNQSRLALAVLCMFHRQEPYPVLNEAYPRFIDQWTARVAAVPGVMMRHRSRRSFQR